MEASLKETGEYLAQELEDAITDWTIALGELTVRAVRTRILDVLKFLRDDPRLDFGLLVDVCGVDYPARPDRFEVVYHLLSLTRNQRIRVKITTDEATPVPSATGLFPTAGWFEREAYDMFGILFSDHPDLRRILTDYGFSGHPLRKDFPLVGHVELRYDPEQRRVVYEPVQLAQDFRSFDNLSPWEGLSRLHGRPVSPEPPADAERDEGEG